MATLPIVRSPQFYDDLDAVWVYIANENPSAADAFVRKIDSKIGLLAIAPRLGELQSQFGTDVRRVIVGRYLLFYRASSSNITVLRLYHSARRLDDLL